MNELYKALIELHLIDTSSGSGTDGVPGSRDPGVKFTSTDIKVSSQGVFASFRPSKICLIYSPFVAFCINEQKMRKNNNLTIVIKYQRA